MKAFLQSQKNGKNVEEICLSNEESKNLYWENDHEFQYKGGMYDVIEKKAAKGQIIIRCIADKKETALLNEYRKNSKPNSSGSTIVQLITAHFVLPDDHSLQQPETVIKQKFIERSSPLQDPASTIVIPPPDVC